MEAALAVLDDLTGASIAGCKGGQAAGHGLNHCQTKCLIQGRLDGTQAGGTGAEGHDTIRAVLIMMAG